MKGPIHLLSAEQSPSSPPAPYVWHWSFLWHWGSNSLIFTEGRRWRKSPCGLWGCGWQAPKGEHWVFCEDGKCSRVFSRTSAHVFGFRSDLYHLDWFPPNHPNLQLTWLSCDANSLCNCSTTQLRSFTVSSRIKTWRQCFLTLTSAVTVLFKLAGRTESKVDIQMGQYLFEDRF